MIFNKKKLTFKIIKVQEVTSSEIQEMKDLFLCYYHHPNPQLFEDDLRRKTHVILLQNSKNEIKGFSTQEVFFYNIDDIEVVGVYSGDTVLEKAHWGDHSLQNGFYFFLTSLKLKYPRKKLYWHLISKGYKTYLLMAFNMKNYWPRYDKETPEFERSLIERFSRERFPHDYDAKKGILSFSQGHEFLKENVAPITEELKLKVPEIQFFATKNPHWDKGDELVCVGEFSLDLIYHFFVRKFKKKWKRP